jgi:hypothetical protein
MSGPRYLKSLLLACAIFVALSSALAQEVNAGKPKKSTTQAVFLSLALPGAGQLYTKNYCKAAGFAVTQGSFIASVWWNENQVKNYIRAHDFVLERFYRNQRNKMIWWLAGMTMLSMGDAYVDAHLYGLDWSPDLSVSERGLSGGVTLAVRF